jgi:hypothetical protein
MEGIEKDFCRRFKADTMFFAVSSEAMAWVEEYVEDENWDDEE